MDRILIGAAALALLAPALQAQTLARRVEGVTDGTVRLSFAARPGVCGSGSSISIHDADDEEWESGCEPGLVRVSLRLERGRIRQAETRVGGRWREGRPGITDFGTVPAPEAADLMLELARRAGDEGEELITAAALADSAVVWPALLGLARDARYPADTRRHAVFWVGQAAGEAATRGLDSIAGDDRGDLDIREHAVFALSQRPADEGVPALIRIARASPHPELRKKALFWLGQSEDPRALDLFEELLQ